MSTTKKWLLQLIKKVCYLESKDEPFVLTNGEKDYNYLDISQALLTSYGHQYVAKALLAEIKEILGPKTSDLPDAVAAVALGGCAMASAVAMKAFKRKQIHVIYVRKYPKEYGTQKAVEAPSVLKKGARVVLFEDVVASGNSSLKAIKHLEEAGFKILVIIALVDRQEGGAKTIQKAGYTFRSLYTLDEIRSLNY